MFKIEICELDFVHIVHKISADEHSICIWQGAGAIRATRGKTSARRQDIEE
jgi:hypothetical protein